MTLTPWIPGHIKPVRHGVYQRKGVHKVYYSMWTGIEWLCVRDTIADAARQKYRSMNQSVPWRGLSQKPKEQP